MASSYNSKSIASEIMVNKKDYSVINDFCNELSIEWFASAWDHNSQIFLRNFNCKYNKVASVMITHEELTEMNEL